MKRLIIDLDGTIALAHPDAAGGYAHAVPDLALVAQLRQYRRDGYEIVVHTSRNMRTYGGNVGKINVHTLPLIIAWLQRHDVPFDEVHVGKPWCGHEGFYVDDRAVRPAEFVRHDAAGIAALLAAGLAEG